jgi:hypothetical protein
MTATAALVRDKERCMHTIPPVSSARGLHCLDRCTGVGGSQLSGIFTGNQDCPPVTKNTVVWFADKWLWGRQMRCWSHHMSLQFDAFTGRCEHGAVDHLAPGCISGSL